MLQTQVCSEGASDWCSNTLVLLWTSQPQPPFPNSEQRDPLSAAVVISKAREPHHRQVSTSSCSLKPKNECGKESPHLRCKPNIRKVEIHSIHCLPTPMQHTVVAEKARRHQSRLAHSCGVGHNGLTRCNPNTCGQHRRIITFTTSHHFEFECKSATIFEVYCNT